jgi:hypothetical protein
MRFTAGDHVLIRARVTDDARNAIIAPGVELPIQAVEVLTDIPDTFPEGLAWPLMLFFETTEDREAFAQDFASWPGAEARELP